MTEYEHKYENSKGEELIGYFIYADREEGETDKRAGLLMFDGPWGDGGGASAREYARQFALDSNMVVFLPDYFTGTHSEDSISDLQDAVGKYGPFLEDTTETKAISLLAYEQLVSLDFVDVDRIGAIGFCFGGAMVLNLARAGATFQVGVSLHGEYPANNDVIYFSF